MIKEIFKAGTWTDANGNTRKFTEKDIDDIISQFSNEKSETIQGRKVPLTPGHPKDDDPALGWVSRIWRDGKSLFAEFVDIIPEAVKAIKAKSFREVSIALTGNTLRHVGLLGAVPPAVPGMGGFKFADGDFMEYSFSEDDRDFMDKIIEKLQKTFNLKKSGDDMPTLEEKLNEENVELKNKVGDLETELSEAQDKIKVLEEEKKAVTAEKEKAETELKASNEKIESFEAEKKELVYTNWLDKMVAEKKLLPAKKEETLLMLKSLEGQAEQEFKQGDETVKKTPQSLYMENIEKGPEALDTKNLQDGQGRKEMGKLEKATREYMKKNDIQDYNLASVKVRELNPELEEAE